MSWLALSILASPAQLRAAEDAPDPAEDQLTASMGVHLSTGDYGLSDDTDTLFVPFAMSYKRGSWMGKITIPFLGMDGPGDPEKVRIEAAPNNSTRTGAGDILFDLSYNVIPDVRIGGRIKFPSASTNKNMGTGEYDFMFSAEYSHKFGNWTPSVRSIFRVLGDGSVSSSRPHFNRKSGFGIRLGVQYDLLDNLDIGASYDLRQSTITHRKDPQKVSAYANYKLNDNLTIRPYGTFGLNSSSVDFGGGVTTSYSF
jgi:opacity protein-like surface antigen